MELGLGVGFRGVRLPESNSSPIALLPRGRYSLFHQPRLVFKRSLSVSVSRSSLPEGGLYGEDVMRIFLKDRQLNGDFISKVSDMLWLWGKENSEFSEDEANTLQEDNPNNGQLKRELLFLTIGIGVACSGYCLVILSFQASLSYAFGVLFSCLYLQLLYHHTDNVSKESVPEIFLQKKIKKIGIRSEDIKNVFEKTIGGIAISLSSPRLVIPAAIYGLWVLSQHFANDYFDFQTMTLIVAEMCILQHSEVFICSTVTLMSFWQISVSRTFNRKIFQTPTTLLKVSKESRRCTSMFVDTLLSKSLK